MTITLTREEAHQVLDALDHQAKIFPVRKAIDVLRARLAQPEPDPVAWCIVENSRIHGLVKSKPTVMNAEKWQPLYTAPPEREWQGLTGEEISDIWGEPLDVMHSGHYGAIRSIEQALKEKNNG